MTARPDWKAGFPVTAGPINLGLVEASPETAMYWAGVDRCELLLKHCPICDRALHPRRIICPRCHAAALEWRAASGHGRVYSFSTIQRAPRPELSPSVPYTVGIVALDEGVHLFSRLQVEDEAELSIGASVTVRYEPLESGVLLPVFGLDSSTRLTELES